MRTTRAPIVAAAVALMLSAAARVLAGPAVEFKEAGVIELSVPRPIASGEAMHLQIKPGRLPPGAEILVRTIEGELLGSLSPFGLRQSAVPLSYSIPVPETALRNGRLELRLEVVEPGARARPPNPDEIESVRIELVKVTN